MLAMVCVLAAALVATVIELDRMTGGSRRLWLGFVIFIAAVWVCAARQDEAAAYGVACTMCCLLVPVWAALAAGEVRRRWNEPMRGRR